MTTSAERPISPRLDPLRTVVHKGRLLRMQVVSGRKVSGGSTIIPGSVVVAYGAAIGAGSLVLHDVPSNAVVAGRPARVIRTR